MAKDVFDGEQCGGCGGYAPEHPVAAVMAAADGAGTILGQSEDGAFVVAAICKLCHEDPAHRQRTVKAHFFESRKQALEAVGFAGERDKGGNPRRASKRRS